MDFVQQVILAILGLILVLLGTVFLRAAATQADPVRAKKYRTRGTLYFVFGAGTITFLLLNLL